MIRTLISQDSGLGFRKGCLKTTLRTVFGLIQELMVMKLINDLGKFLGTIVLLSLREPWAVFLLVLIFVVLISCR